MSASSSHDESAILVEPVLDAGGTRIGDALHTFNYQWGRRVLRGGAVVLLISDGWDRGDPDELGELLFEIRYRGHVLDFAITPTRLTVTTPTSDAPAIRLRIRDLDLELQPGSTEVVDL